MGMGNRQATKAGKRLGAAATVATIAAIVVAAILAATLVGCSSTGGTTGRDGGSAAAGRDWDAIRESGTIVFGTEGTYSPYSYHDEDGELTGYDVELARAVAERLGLRAEFSEMGFDGLAASLDTQKVDAVANQICMTEERQRKYLFSTPYAYAHGVVIAREGRDDIRSLDDLSGKTVALTLTSNWAKLAEAHGATILSTGGFSESIRMVIDERADATVNDNIVFLDYETQHPDDPVAIVATDDEVNTVALMLGGGQDELRERIDEALGELDGEGFLTELSQRYFGEDVAHETAEAVGR